MDIKSRYQVNGIQSWYRQYLFFLSFSLLRSPKCRKFVDKCYASDHLPPLFRYPWHASCKLTWKMSLSCQEFRSRILLKMSEWEVRTVLIWLTDLQLVCEGEENCGQTSSRCPVLPCGQNCLYQFLSSTEKTITATHTTPATRSIVSRNKVEELSLIFVLNFLSSF